MSATLEQIFTTNPTTIIDDTDLFYLARSPYTPGNDFGISGLSLKNIFGTGGTVNPGLINQLAYYASSGNTVSGLTTASNGLLVTNNSGTPSVLAGPGATGRILQSNSASAPSFSTATYPSVATGTGTILRANGTNWIASTATFSDTYAASSLLYSNGANTVTGLATVNRASLSTNSTGVPTWLALTDGQLIIGSTAGSPAAASLSAGSGITITPGSNSITIAAINSGTVTSISAGTGITLTPNPITSTGSVALTTPVTEILGGTNQTTYVLGDTLYASAANTLSKLPGNATTAKQYLSQTGTGVVSAAPAWATISGADITGAALTKTDDTNVTLTLGGTPSTALLRAASITAGWTGQLGLTRGGTNASLTASNGGIVYSSASALAILSGTATANQVLLSGSSTTPAWSTATYPATTTINQILYSSAANVISGLATANNGVLVTNGSGVPSIAAAIVAANLPAFGGSGVSFMGSTTFNTTSASGSTTVVTGVGFQPSLVIFISAVVGGGSFGSVGFDNGSTRMTVSNATALTTGQWNINTSNSIVAQGAAGNNQVGQITAFGSDGFTITWTKTGTPSGTLTIGFLCFK